MALLFIPAALPPQRSAGFLPGQPHPAQWEILRPAFRMNPRWCSSVEPSFAKTFPGPPNYESIERGDKPEVLWWLVLSQPICMEEDVKEPSLSPAQKDIRKIQLVFRDAAAYETHEKLVGKTVVAKGTLFGAHTGHHHTGLLLTVTTLTKAG